MKTIFKMENKIMNYDWGDRKMMLSIIEGKNQKKPMAELWMGAHAKAPSKLQINNKKENLLNLIKKNPKKILGKEIQKKSGNQFPYLFKILAIRDPLSLQVHPNKSQAKNGFLKENRQGLNLDDPIRDFKDPNNKPELIVALKNDFWALCGFRKKDEIYSNLKNIVPETVLKSSSFHLKKFFFKFIKWREDAKPNEIKKILRKITKKTDKEKWVKKIFKRYPNDLSALAPLFLNLYKLKKYEGLILKPGTIHAYLKGAGVELMGNSDNVVRGGLTLKKVNLKELTKITNFKISDNYKVKKKNINHNIEYISDFKEFKLEIIKFDKKFETKGPEIIFIRKTGQTIENLEKKEKIIPKKKGESYLLLPNCRYEIQGKGEIYKASINF